MRASRPSLRSVERAFDSSERFLACSRKKLINLYLDFDMNEEAVAEMEGCIEQYLSRGQVAKAEELVEKMRRSGVPSSHTAGSAGCKSRRPFLFAFGQRDGFLAIEPLDQLEVTGDHERLQCVRRKV